MRTPPGWVWLTGEGETGRERGEKEEKEDVKGGEEEEEEEEKEEAHVAAACKHVCAQSRVGFTEQSTRRHHWGENI